MQSENFDNKLKQAAEQHHPNYDEKAWANMEKLLDRELPQKEDRRRRFIFFLLFPLLIGAGLWLFISKPWQPETISAGTTENKTTHINKTSIVPGPAGTGNEPAEKPVNENRQAGSDIKNPEPVEEQSSVPKDDITPAKVKPGSVTAGVNTQGNLQNKSFSTPKKSVKNTGNNFDIGVLPGSIAKKDDQQNNKTVKNDKAQQEINTSAGNIVITPANDNKNNKPLNTGIADSNKPVEPLVSKTGALPAELSKAKKDSVTELSEKPEEKIAKKQNPGKKKNTLFFSFSAGPDISFVGWDDLGKVKTATGAGIGYTFRDRWTIRTGFYSAGKVYNAKPADYKPSVSVMLPDYLKNVAADCKVYEIPLTVAYNFGRSAKYKTFAAAGLSSIIMKKEQYRYMYLYPGSPDPFYYTHQENNKYKHYFSVLSLSAGYQRKISRTLSIAVEPYLKLPLSGVGYGRVKLNSAGVLFSLNVSPFQGGAR